ncbi:hypothetical protein SAMN05518855_1004220 [Paenibacillus sp. CF384]|nr:hypothetical protein SAMN05518855_1004220 [Paenibacillus sp. CF384]
MPAFIDWITAHWFSSLVILLAIFAIAYVTKNHKSLFYKE